MDYFLAGNGAVLRYGVWPAEAGRDGAPVILLQGRSEFLEKYAETIADLNRRGWDVFSFDWRGQGLSVEPQRPKGYIASYDDYVRDLTDFIERIVAPRFDPPYFFLAHSMGAHLFLRFARDRCAMIRRAVLVAPMISINSAPLPEWLLRWITRSGLRLFGQSAFLWGSRRRSLAHTRFTDNPYTSDRRRFARLKRFLAEDPRLELPGIPFAWLAATFDSIDRLNSCPASLSINRPLLIVSAGADRVVSLDAQEEFCARLADCRRIVIAEARHEVLIETDAVRARFWEAFDSFMGTGL